MIDYIWFIIVGLGLDIIGAVLIVKPILYFKGIWTGKFLDYIEKLNSDDAPKIVKKKNQNGLVWNNFIGIRICFADLWELFTIPERESLIHIGGSYPLNPLLDDRYEK